MMDPRSGIEGGRRIESLSVTFGRVPDVIFESKVEVESEFGIGNGLTVMNDPVPSVSFIGLFSAVRLELS